MFDCTICDISISTVYKFKQHLLTKTHIAKIAKQSNPNPSNQIVLDNTKLNLATPNQLPKPKFICKCCKKEVSSKFNLKRHIETCEEVKIHLQNRQQDMINEFVNDIITDMSANKINAIQMPSAGNTLLNNLIPSPTKGIIYLIQPVELISTNRYKLGCSGKISLDRCITGYKKGSRYIYIQECFEPYKLETKLKLEFKQKFTLIAGTEYFAGDERQMKTIFNEITELHDTSYAIFYNSTLPNSQNIEIPATTALTNLLLA